MSDLEATFTFTILFLVFWSLQCLFTCIVIPYAFPTRNHDDDC